MRCTNRPDAGVHGDLWHRQWCVRPVCPPAPFRATGGDRHLAFVHYRLRPFALVALWRVWRVRRVRLGIVWVLIGTQEGGDSRPLPVLLTHFTNGWAARRTCTSAQERKTLPSTPFH